MPSTTDPGAPPADGRAAARAHQLVAAGLATLAVAGWSWWFVWRLTRMTAHPVPLMWLLVELSAAASGVTVAGALVVARRAGEIDEAGAAEGAYPAYVAALTGNRPSVSWAVGTDGARRMCGVAVATIGLLFGVAPFPLPPLTAAVAVTIAGTATALAIVIASGRRIRLGDRLRWSFASHGELFRTGPRRPASEWTGTMAALVLVSLAVALRGMSDRWTHGLDPMSHAERVTAMTVALSLAAGAVYTLITTEAPAEEQPVPRRHEERTARPSALGGAAVVGVIGLFAGLLPGGVDTAEHDPARIEQVSERPPAIVADD